MANERKVVWTTKKVEDAARKLNEGFILPSYENPFFEKTVGLRKAGISFGMTQHEIDEYTKCKLDVRYFAEKYCYIKLEDGSYGNMRIRDYQYDILDLYDNNKYSILMASRQVGKAQPLDSTVWTKEGKFKFGDLKIGDKIYDDSGELTTVNGIFPQGVKDIYEIEFSDGSKVKCCKEHLWTIEKYGKEKTIELQEIEKDLLSKRGDTNYYVKVNQPVNYPSKNLKMDPYLMGILIGDGGIKNSSIIVSNKDEEVIEYLYSIEDKDIKIVKCVNNKYDYRISKKSKNGGVRNKYREILEECNLLGKGSDEKFIPVEYLYGSIDQRISLLQGLMDTDGTSFRNRPSFTTTSERLSRDFKELCNSLGIICSISVKDKNYYTYNGEKRKGKKSYNIRLYLKNDYPYPIFRIKRKQDLIKNKKFDWGSKRGIRKITHIGKEETQCISVSNESRLYLTDNYIPTHNTVFASIYILHFMLFNNTKNVLLAANILDTSKEVLDKIKEIYSYLPFFLQQGIGVWSVTQIRFENRCRAKAFAMTKNASIGNTGDLVYIDEFAHIQNTVADKFYKSIFPTLTNVKNSKLIITSTPNGYNLFHKLLTDSERDVTDPLKNNFASLRVYWYEVPGRNVTYLKINPHLLPQHGLTIENVLEQCKELYNPKGLETSNGTPIVRLVHNQDTGNPEIHIQNNEKLKYEDILQTEFINKDDDVVHCKTISQISTWKLDAIKDIGGEDNFNSEYDLRFSSGSKSVLSESTLERLMESKRKFIHHKHDIFKQLRWDYSSLKFVDGWNEESRKKIHIMMSIDISEGLGQDYSVINMFKLDYKPFELIEEQKESYKKLSDFFQLKQFGMFRSNVVSHAQLAEMAYLLIFEYFDPDKIKVVFEYNNDGKAFLAEIKNVFEKDNDYSGYVMLKFKHRIDAAKKSYGLKVGTLKNKYVKDYQDRMERQDFIIHNETNIKEVGTFIKHVTSAGNIVYKGDGSCDDCVLPNTLITTNDGIKMIKDIKIGDMVLTHKGRYKKVINIGNRHSDYIYNIKSNNKLDLSITNNHELFLFEKKNYTNKDRKLRFLENPKWLSIDDGIDVEKHYTSFIPNQNIKDIEYIDLYEYCDKKKFIIKEDKIYSIINENTNIINPSQNPINRYLEINDDICFVFGYYIAEGSRNGHQISFASHTKESNIRKKIYDIFSQMGLHPFETNGRGNSHRITISSKLLSNFFKIFGKKEDKKFPSFCNYLPHNKLRNIIHGYLLGDGGFSSKGIRSVSISPSVSFFIYESLVKLGYKPSLKIQKQPINKTYENQKKFVYCVNVNNYDKKDILKYMRENVDNNVLLDKNIKYPSNVSDLKSYQKNVNNYLIGKIRSIEKIKYDGIVYNLEVEDDNSYVANGIIVHNCAMTLVNMSQGWKNNGFKEMLNDYHHENGREVIKNLVNSILNKDVRSGTDYDSFFRAKNSGGFSSRMGGKIDVKNLF